MEAAKIQGGRIISLYTDSQLAKVQQSKEK